MGGKVFEIFRPLNAFVNRYEFLNKKEDDYFINSFNEWNSKYTFESVDSIEKVNEMVIDLLKMPTATHSKENVVIAGEKLKKIASKNEIYRDFILKKMNSRKNDSIVSYWRFELILAG